MADLCNIINSSDTTFFVEITMANLYGHILITSLNNGIDIDQSVINANKGVDGLCIKMHEKMKVEERYKKKDALIYKLEKELKELKESKEK